MEFTASNQGSAGGIRKIRGSAQRPNTDAIKRFLLPEREQAKERTLHNRSSSGLGQIPQEEFRITVLGGSTNTAR